jgi:hypothetical protein
MYRNILITSLIVLLAVAGCGMAGSQPGGNVPEMALADTGGEPSPDLGEISAEMPIPPALPNTIQDPLLMQGWIALYNRTDTVELWDGYSTSGRQLAQFVIDQAVVVGWNTNPSYSGSWVDRSGTGNVYITPEIRGQADGQMTALVELLAHELFHRTAPFGQVEVTQYEEYWAFYAGAYVAGKSQAEFYYTNPLNAASLANWFEHHNRGGYPERLDPYPANVSEVIGE